MKHTVLALMLSTGLLASGCAHGPRSTAHQLDTGTAVLLIGVAAVSVGILIAGQSAGSPQCTDPLGRCGDYDLPPSTP